MSSKKDKKVGFNKPMGFDVVVQVSGSEIGISELRDRCVKALERDPWLSGIGAKVNSLKIYVKPEDGKAYYVAKTSAGEATGCVDLF